MDPENSALPRASRGTGFVSSAISWIGSPALQTMVPVIAVTGPGVPLNIVPLITRPSTSKKVAPVERLTLALPLRTLHAKVPLSICDETGLSTPCDVITPTMLLHRATVPSVTTYGPLLRCAKAEEATNKRDKTAASFFTNLYSFH